MDNFPPKPPLNSVALHTAPPHKPSPSEGETPTLISSVVQGAQDQIPTELMELITRQDGTLRLVILVWPKTSLSLEKHIGETWESAVHSDTVTVYPSETYAQWQQNGQQNMAMEVQYQHAWLAGGQWLHDTLSASMRGDTVRSATGIPLGKFEVHMWDTESKTSSRLDMPEYLCTNLLQYFCGARQPYTECTLFAHAITGVPLGSRTAPREVQASEWLRTNQTPEEARTGEVLMCTFGDLLIHWAVCIAPGLFISKYGRGPVFVTSYEQLRHAYPHTEAVVMRPALIRE